MIGQPQRPNYRGPPNSGMPDRFGGLPPASVGHNDLMPGGLQRPPPGMNQPMPGMMMGPEHQIF